MAQAPTLFYGSTSFGDGGWAPELKKAIASRPRFIPTWRPKSRIWRGTFVQWVQYEPDLSIGPFFWSGKPALRASSASKVAHIEEALFVGYYVERGVLKHQIPAQVMDQGWHWHGFTECLTKPRHRGELNALMLNLPETRSAIWIDCSRVEEPDGKVHDALAEVILYTGPKSLDEANEIIASIPPTQWINVMLGSRFTKAECLKRQGDLVAEFRNPLIRANEIRDVVENARPVTAP